MPDLSPRPSLSMADVLTPEQLRRIADVFADAEHDPAFDGAGLRQIAQKLKRLFNYRAALMEVHRERVAAADAPTEESCEVPGKGIGLVDGMDTIPRGRDAAPPAAPPAWDAEKWLTKRGIRGHQFYDGPLDWVAFKGLIEEAYAAGAASRAEVPVALVIKLLDAIERPQSELRFIDIAEAAAALRAQIGGRK